VLPPPPARKTASETSTPGPDLACAPAASWPQRWPPPPTRTNSRRAAVSAAAASPTGRADGAPAAGSSPPPPDGGSTGAAQSAGAPPPHPRRRGRRWPRVHGSWAGGRPVSLDDGRKEGERRGAGRGSRGGMWWRRRGGGWGLLGTPLPGPGFGPAFVSAHSCRTGDKLFIFLLQYIHSYNHSLITFAEAHFHIFTAAGSVGGTTWGAEPRFELGPALQQASVLPSELRCTRRQTRS
jgi:hypothetical protein